MAATARFLRLAAAAAACCCFLLAPRGAAVSRSPLVIDANGDDDDIVEIAVDAGNATAQDPAAAAKMAATIDFMAAEAAAGAALMAAEAAAARNGTASAEWEVWDPEEGDMGMGVAVAGKAGALSPQGMAVGARGPAGALSPQGVAVGGPPPMTWSPADLAAVFPGEGAMPAGLVPPGLMQPPPAPPAPPVAAPLDALLDFALGAVAHEFVANHSTEVPVPDFKKLFKAKLGFITVHGHLEAQGGTVGDLSSLFRDGSATLRREKGGVLVMDVAAGLRTLRLKYRHYSARAGPIRVSGVIQAEASPVTLRAQVSMTPPCRAQLRSLAVASVGRVRVKASGLGALRRLLPLLERWLQKRMRGDVERSVLQRLEGIVNQQLRKLTC